MFFQSALDLTCAALSAFWTCGIITYVLKPHVPPLSAFLTYGKLTCHPVSERFSVCPAQIWPLYYVTGFITSLVSPMVFTAIHVASVSQTSLPLLLFQFQTLRRLLECLFVHKFNSKRRMPLLQALCPIVFYICSALTLVASSSFETTGSLNERLVVSLI